MAHDVFISYSSHDKPIADAVCAALEQERIRCWIAPRDVLPGVPYGEALIDAINGSHILILLVSSNSNHSPQVMREVERAVSKGIHILPFRIEEIELCKELEYYISTPHWLDALTSPLEEHLARLAQTASMLLSKEPHGEDPSSTGAGEHAGITTPPAARPSVALDSVSGPAASAAATEGRARPAAAAAGRVASETPATTSGAYSLPAPAMTTSGAFLRRFASNLIDGLILSVLWFVGFATLLAAAGSQAHGADVSTMTSTHLLAGVIGIVVVIGYGAGMLATRGQTLGKMALGLRVAGPGGGNPSFWRAALRESIGKLVSGYVLCLGYLWMLWDGKQQTWHDKMAQTHVELAG